MTQVKKEDIDKLLCFLPLFDVSDRSFALTDNSETKDLDVHFLPYSAYEDYVLEFFRLIQQPCWHVEDLDYEKLAEVVYCSCHIARADLSVLRKLLTWCVTFVGTSEEKRQMIVEDGRITVILKRLKKIREHMD